MFFIASQVWQGYSLTRTFFHHQVSGLALSGDILDLGSGASKPAYYRYLKLSKPYTLTLTDHYKTSPDTLIIDMETRFDLHRRFNFVLMMNVLEHLYHPTSALQNALKHLKKSGKLIGFVPFLVGIHPDPADYFRYTSQSLTRILSDVGFSRISVSSVGAGPFIAGLSLVLDFIPVILRPVFVYPSLLIDQVIIRFSSYHRERYPLGYLFTATKSL